MLFEVLHMNSLNDIWDKMRNLTGYTLQNWYIPEKINAKKRPGDKK